MAPALLVLAACAPNASFAGLRMGPRRASFHERILTRRLANGLRVILLPKPRTNLVTVAVRYEVGFADDPRGQEGLAHYVEHVLFEGGVRDRRAGALRDPALGENAWTALDETYFYATALDADLDRELEIAARRLELTCNDLDPDALARERDVVIEEEKLRSRGRWNDEAIETAIWGAGHPYARPAPGAGFATATTRSASWRPFASGCTAPTTRS